MSVNPVPSVGDVIFLMYYTCCTPGNKAAMCLTLSNSHSSQIAPIVYIRICFICHWGIYSKAYIYRKKWSKLQMPAQVCFSCYWHFR